MLKRFRLVLYLIVIITGVVRGDTGHWKLKDYLNVELYLLNDMDRLSQEKTSRMDILDRWLSQLVSVTPDNMDKMDYLGNPLSVLTMVRRLFQDWRALAATVGKQSALWYFGLQNSSWPEGKDAAAAARGMVRVQSTYNLSTEVLAAGKLDGSTMTASVTAVDCFLVGLQFYEIGMYAEAAEWLQQSLSRIRTTDTSISRPEVLLYLAAALCFTGNSQSSESALITLMEEYPEIQVPAVLENEYKFLSSKQCKMMKVKDRGNQEKPTEEELHSKLCRGDSDTGDKRLRCRYVHYHQPHLRIQPFKLEEVQLEPPVLLFHDVITDLEAEILKREATDKIEVASTLAADGSWQQTDYRTSHVAWMMPGVSKVSDNVARRVADITQLDVTYAEVNQLARYGVAGEYLPHTDCFGDQVKFEKDRLATLMFYLNEVQQGGHTVFLDWGLSVPPVKNSAILWFHYLPSGVEDNRSSHSGCPVLQGSKWVLNKWILNGGNEFRFPCALNRNATLNGYYTR